MDVKVKMPSVIVSLEVEVGAAVTKGQVVAVVEAMKMKNNSLAPADGTVKSIAVKAGDRLKPGGVIMTIE
ncbi:Acetyl-CoA carboxylase biotin carboxyl carrier protein subunit [Rhodovastum atsumiense]|uniref:Acetyl-CoA carboxylase biotin carboxyl carrier protein subunit n=1 Tax=Rhodovastum atsumiense TaxID=504468 RepID=A0A5M6IM10_9PROT|nr:biotin/lipoyl-containing protein [Rhodovastum atsumiense]KAA5608967.1 acetyl-CoA carboxylase biotin carboxyl carrier protein subunit [Rhodovastum atsumiense]CAH2603688.1 Acetyl-CoA carboxylase biotin carboxyl carrier protein subunit [Rhodovastum atsumiense]